MAMKRSHSDVSNAATYNPSEADDGEKYDAGYQSDEDWEDAVSDKENIPPPAKRGRCEGYEDDDAPALFDQGYELLVYFHPGPADTTSEWGGDYIDQGNYDGDFYTLEEEAYDAEAEFDDLDTASELDSITTGTKNLAITPRGAVQKPMDDVDSYLTSGEEAEGSRKYSGEVAVGH